MIETPWGNAEELRQRRLPPGPGQSAKKVARNQRERLFGAMVACVATRGFAETRVTDLTDLSGVSRRSFYDLFDDLGDCFEATIEEIVTGGMALWNALESPSSWEELSTTRIGAYCQLIANQPAAARVCLIDSYVAGPKGEAPIEGAVRMLEGAIEAGLTASPTRAGMPHELVVALVGSVLELSRNRLIEGTEEELPKISAAINHFTLSFRNPPESLRLTTRPQITGDDSIQGHNHADRALNALAAVVAEKGYATTTVDDIVKRAEMSPTTFYANFSGKADALIAAIDAAGAQLSAAVMPAYRRSTSSWPHAVRSALGALFNFLASKPALASLVLADVYAVGPKALERRAASWRDLTEIVSDGFVYSPQVPGVSEELIIGGIFALAHRQLRTGGAQSLPALAPVCTYLVVAPFLGADTACRAANGDGHARRSQEFEAVIDRSSAEKLQMLLRTIEAGVSDPGKLARAVGTSAEEMDKWLRELEGIGMIVLSDGGEPKLRTSLRLIETAEWEELPESERRRITSLILDLVLLELRRARNGGTLHAVDRHLSRNGATVDRAGWQELMEVHDRALRESLEVAARSSERLRTSGEEPIQARSFLALFEMPEADQPDPQVDKPAPQANGSRRPAGPES